MTALAADRPNQSVIFTKSRAFDSIAASVAIYCGAMLSMDSSGYIRPARATASDKVLGVASRAIPSQAGAGAPADGGKVLVESDGYHRMGNSATVDAITNAHVGRTCFVVDDQTVALTSAGGTRPRAGRVHKVDSTGVYVDFSAPAKALATVTVDITDVSAASDSTSGYAPFPGTIIEIASYLGGAITGADAAVTPKIGSTAITGGALTIANVGSAADVRDYAHPTAAHRVAAGDKLIASTDGASSTTATLKVVFLIEAD